MQHKEIRDRTKVVLIASSIMCAVTFVVTFGCIYFLYHTAVEEQKGRLLDIVRSRARLIEAANHTIVDHNRERHIGDHKKETTFDIKSVLQYFVNVPKEQKSIMQPSGKSGDTPGVRFIVAGEHEGEIYFIVNPDKMSPVPVKRLAKKPMGLALADKSGVLITKDRLGQIILTAFAPIESLNWGLVAKIRLSDIRTPFVKTGVISLGCALLLVLIGAGIMWKTVSPLVDRLEEALDKLQKAHVQMVQSEKLASIGQLAAGVAHEINNPMGYISSNLHALQKYTLKLTAFIHAHKVLKPTDELENLRKKLKIDFILEDLENLFEESQEGAARVKEIVQNLKSFSRVDETQCKEADLNECLENTIKVIWNELKYKAKVIKEYGEIPLLKCYPQQLNQVFLNFLVNAAHAIENHGEITVKTWQDGKDIFVSISDTGHGIPVENINKLFEPFFTTKEVGKGTGLGLSISYEIIQNHNGAIDVESEVGRGTTFTVTIPVAGIS